MARALLLRPPLIETVPTASNGSRNGKGTDDKASGLGVAGGRINREGLPAGTPLPDFTLPDLAREQRPLAEFRGASLGLGAKPLRSHLRGS